MNFGSNLDEIDEYINRVQPFKFRMTMCNKFFIKKEFFYDRKLGFRNTNNK